MEAPTKVPSGKLSIRGAKAPVKVYDAPVDKEADAPHFVLEAEQTWYVKIHGLQNRTLKELQQIWTSFKEVFASTIEKTATLELAVTKDQTELFAEMLNQLDGVADRNFLAAVRLGNDYFSDQFQVQGLNKKQQEQVAEKHVSIFSQRAENLFHKDVVSNLRETPLDKWMNVLNGFDKYLLGYSNAVASVAYDAYVRDITLLNKGLGAAYSLAGKGKTGDVVKVVWVLDPQASHSDDCWNMSELDNFGYGPGVWDAEYLSSNNLVPRSPALDCGGNCKCHLTAFVPLEAEQANWLDRMIKSPQIRNVLDLVPNMSENQLMKFFDEADYDFAGGEADPLKKIIASHPQLRRSEFWKKLPSFIIDDEFKEGPFSINGTTVMNFDQRKPEFIMLHLTMPKGTDLNALTAFQKRQIADVVAHELGHTIANDILLTGSPIGIFGDDVAKALYTAAAKERELALGQIQINFDNVVDQIAESSMTKEIRRDIAVMDVFMSNPSKFLDDLFNAVQKGEKFGGVDAKEAWKIVDRVLAQYSPGTMITRTYQLWNTDEYFADWFALLLLDPEKAALFSPRLTAVAADVLPKSFFDSAIRRRVANLLPEAISASRRIDLPLPTKFDPIAANMDDVGLISHQVQSITKNVSTDTVGKEVADLVTKNPNMQRTEYFKDLGVVFVDKVQMAKRAGSQRVFGYWDPDTELFVVNYDRWAGLSETQKGVYIADILAQQMYKSGASSFRKLIADRFTTYLDASLRYLERKGVLEDLRPEDLRSIREVIIGAKPLEDEATGELRGGIPRNLDFWTRNFESVFKPILQKITDFPILNVDSLASPEAYFREWLRLYFTSPQNAQMYPGFRDIITKFLSIEKSLFFGSDVHAVPFANHINAN